MRYVSSNLVSDTCCGSLQKHNNNTLVFFKVAGKLVGKASNKFFCYAFNVFCANLPQASLSPKQLHHPWRFIVMPIKVNIHKQKG
jgi:hypothetical protein